MTTVPIDTIARLRITPRSAAVTIHADPTLESRYQARFTGPAPAVHEEADIVTIEYPRFAARLPLRRRIAELRLDASVAWAIEILGGVSNLRIDLRGVDLRSLEIRGGATRVVADLPEPKGEMAVRVSGGVSNLTIRRPDGVPACLRITGGASRLALDGQRLGAVGGEVRLESPGAADAAGRPDVHVGGGASNLTVATYGFEDVTSYDDRITVSQLG
jgi:hypothetical protein